MSNIVSFDNAENTIEEEKTQFISMPTQEEIAILNALTKRYGKDEMVDVAHWNGSCWRRIFEEIEDYAKEKEFDTWDCFAVVLTKLLGTEFTFENGSVVVKTRSK